MKSQWPGDPLSDNSNSITSSVKPLFNLILSDTCTAVILVLTVNISLSQNKYKKYKFWSLRKTFGEGPIGCCTNRGPQKYGPRGHKIAARIFFKKTHKNSKRTLKNKTCEVWGLEKPLKLELFIFEETYKAWFGNYSFWRNLQVMDQILVQNYSSGKQFIWRNL